MKQHIEYNGFVYAGWQSPFDAATPAMGFHLYTCRRCGTTISEKHIPEHTKEECSSVLKAEQTTLEKLL